MVLLKDMDLQITNHLSVQKSKKNLDYVTKDETIIVKNYYNRNYSDLEIKVL